MSKSNQNSENTINDIADSPNALNLLFSDWVSKENEIYTFKQDFKDKLKSFDEIQRIILTGAGSSYNAAYNGMYFFNSISRIDATAVLPSELLILPPVASPDNTLLIIISQSGETKEIIKNMEALKRKNPNIKILGLTATIKGKLWDCVNQSDVFDINSGIELGKTSTKFYINSLMALYFLSCYYDCEKERLTDIKNSLSNYDQYIPWLIKEYNNINKSNDVQDKNFISPSVFINKLEGYLKSSPSQPNGCFNKPIVLVGMNSTYACAKEGRMKVLEFANYPCIHIDSTELKHATINFLSPLHGIDYSNIPIVFLLPTSENYYECIKNDIDNAIDYAFLSIFKRSDSNRKEIDIEEIIRKQVRNQSVDEILNCMVELKDNEIEKVFFREWRKIVVIIINGIEIELGDAIYKKFRNCYNFFFICPWDLNKTKRWTNYFENDKYELFLTNQLEREGEKSDFDEIIIDEFRKKLEDFPDGAKKDRILLIKDVFLKNKNIKRIFIENPIISVTRKDLFSDEQFVYLKGKNQNSSSSEIDDVHEFLTYIPFFWIFAYGLSKKLINDTNSTSKQPIVSPDNMLIHKYYSYKPRHPKELEEHLNLLTTQMGISEKKFRRFRIRIDYIEKAFVSGIPLLVVFLVVTIFIIITLLWIFFEDICEIISKIAKEENLYVIVASALSILAGIGLKTRVLMKKFFKL